MTGGDPNLAAILERVASILSDLHLDGLAIQRDLGDLITAVEVAPEHLADIQRLDSMSQTHADLSAFVQVLAQDVETGCVDNDRLRDALRLGAMKKILLDEHTADHTSNHREGDVAFF